MPHSGAARGLGQGPVGGRLSEQQRLPQQPQVLAAGLRAQRGVRGCPAEAPGACSRPPWQRLPGRGPAPLEGSPPGPGAPPHGTWRPEPPEPPACPFHPHPIRSESTGLASLPPAWVCLLAKGKQRKQPGGAARAPGGGPGQCPLPQPLPSNADGRSRCLGSQSLAGPGGVSHVSLPACVSHVGRSR